MKEKLMRFMAGRYGSDQLNRFLSFLALALLVLNLFFRGALLWVLAVAALLLCYVRMFSRNLDKRRAENARYLRLRYKITGAVRGWMDRQKQRRDYRFFRCPSCHTLLRVPKNKGKLLLTCRKCGNRFERKT